MTTPHITRRFSMPAMFGGLALAAAMLTAAPAAMAADQAQSRATRDWARAIAHQVDRHMSYPAYAALNRQNGLAEVEMRIAPGGEVSEVSLSRSTGFPALDEAALRTAQKIKNLPALPAHLSADGATVKLKLAYMLSDPDAPLTARAPQNRKRDQNIGIYDIAKAPGNMVASVTVLTSDRK